MTTSGLRVLLLMTGALMVAATAQAQQPSPAAKAAAAGTQSAAAAASRPSAKPADRNPPGAPANAATGGKAADPSAQLIRDARNAGFKPMQVRGALMFCRIAVELGSNFPVRTCYNEQQTEIKIREYRTQRSQIRQGRFLPAGMPQGCSARSCQ